MDKYEVLEKKLSEVNLCISSITLDNRATMNYLKQYQEYVKKLIYAAHTKAIRNSNGALLGLTRGLSDYDELCSYDKLWKLATEADNYYCNECKKF